MKVPNPHGWTELLPRVPLPALYTVGLATCVHFPHSSSESPPPGCPISRFCAWVHIQVTGDSVDVARLEHRDVQQPNRPRKMSVGERKGSSQGSRCQCGPQAEQEGDRAEGSLLGGQRLVCASMCVTTQPHPRTPLQPPAVALRYCRIQKHERCG